MNIFKTLTGTELIALLAGLAGLLTAVTALYKARSDRQSIRAQARKDVAEAWEELCASQREQVEQLVRQLAAAMSRIQALEQELEEARAERDQERERRVALEGEVAELRHKVAELERTERNRQGD